MISPDEILHLARQRLGKKRLEHTCNVADMAVQLARRHGVEEQKARIAALLHDICKEEPPETQLQRAEKFGIIFDDQQLASPKVWHGFAAAEFAAGIGITDREILDAVCYHTTGRADMTPLDLVVFLADAVSAERDYPGVEELRRLAFEDLEQAFFESIRANMEELSHKGRPLIRDTWQAYNRYCPAASHKKEGRV